MGAELERQRDLEEQFIMPTFGRKPVCLVEGSGMRLRDDEGREYLDFIAGIGVCGLGHCHPAVVAAIQGQAARLIHVSNYYWIEGRGQVAQAVSNMCNAYADDAARTPWKSFFANSGAEANECAMKLARLYAKRRGSAATTIVTLEGSFHGRTMETLAATAQPAKQEAFQPLPEGFLHTPINDVAALERLFAAHGGEVCAVMIECIQGEGGVHPMTDEFAAAVERLAHGSGALVIVDEVQTGIYRTGRPFGFQHFGMAPDIVSIAKGIASGMPMGICAARADVADAFSPGDHGSTFGGSNLAVAAAGATLGCLQKAGFAEHVEEVGAYLRERLAAIPQLHDVRGFGLMVGCDVDAAMGLGAPDVVSAGLGAGLLLNATGPSTLRFLPPLVCEKADVDVLAEWLGGFLQSATKHI